MSPPNVDLECLGRIPEGSVRIIYNIFSDEPNIIGIFRVIDDSEIDITTLPIADQDSLFDQCAEQYKTNKTNNPI